MPLISERKKRFTIQRKLSAVSASTEQIDQLVYGSSQIKAVINSLYDGVTALQNNVRFAAYKAAMNQNGLNIDDLQTANAQTIEALSAQITALNEQIAFLEQIGGDPSQIEQLKATAEQLKGIVTLINGKSSAVVSFVSEKNTNVKSVQFVIQTDEIKVEKVEVNADAVKEKLTFWQKIRRLFGLY